VDEPDEPSSGEEPEVVDLEPVEDPPTEPVEDPPTENETVDATEAGDEQKPPALIDRSAPEPPPQLAGLVHTPPQSATIGETLNLTVELPSPDYQVMVFYRPKGGTYSQKLLFGNGNSFSGQLPIDERFVEGMEYWIKATPRSDGKAYTFKSGFSPKAVPVR